MLNPEAQFALHPEAQVELSHLNPGATNTMNHSDERFPLLPIITGVFVCILVLTPSASSKFITIGTYPFVGTLNIVGSTLFFPISYLFGDVLTEVYGYERSRRIIWIGFAAQLFSAAMYALIQAWPAASFWTNQAAYDAILGQAPRIVAASLSAYFIGEFVNSFIVSRLKYKSGGRVGRALAFRFVSSTIVAEFLDSAIFMGVGFAGVLHTSDIVRTVLTIWIIKTVYEMVALPLTIPFVRWIKRREAVDQIDRPEYTNYTPFKI